MSLSSTELARQNCTSDDALLETETLERGCREPEESGNLVEESKNLVEKSTGPVEISGNLAEERWDLTVKSENLVEESRNLAEESKNLVEESRSPLVPENCSIRECLANPAAAVRGPGSLPGYSSPTSIAPLALTAFVSLEAAAVPADLSQLTPSPPCPLSMRCWEPVGQNCSPPAAGTGAEPLSLLAGAGSFGGICWASLQAQGFQERAANPVASLETVWDKAWHGIGSAAQTAPGWLSSPLSSLGDVCHLTLLLGCLQG